VDRLHGRGRVERGDLATLPADVLARTVDDLNAHFKIDHAAIQFETGMVACDLEPDHIAR
jgi:hypothetical protein